MHTQAVGFPWPATAPERNRASIPWALTPKPIRSPLRTRPGAGWASPPAPCVRRNGSEGRKAFSKFPKPFLAEPFQSSPVSTLFAVLTARPVVLRSRIDLHLILAEMQESLE